MLLGITEADAIKAMVVEAIKVVAPEHNGGEVVDEAIRLSGSAFIPSDETAFCAFASGPLYDAADALMSGDHADSLMGQVDWMRRCLGDHRTSGVFRNLVSDSLSLAGVRVVVVDDDPAVLRALARCLPTYGASVVNAHSAEEAMQICTAQPPDVVLADYDMPAGSGATLASMLQLAMGQKAPPVVCLTGRSSVPKHADFVAVLHKPVHPTRLVAIIAEACEHPTLPPDSGSLG